MKLKLTSIRKINKTWAALGAALAIGVVAALAARSYLSTQIEAIEARGHHDTIEIVVAKADVIKGSVLSRENLALRRIPVQYVQSGAVRPEDFVRIDGKVVAYDLKGGEMIMWSQMERQRVPTFSARLVPGHRAITVVVDEINSISGMLEPGDLIDLMFSIDQNGKKVVLPLLQSVQVMATGQRSVDDPKSGERMQFATVTLDTTPDQAKNIIIARETGKLTALLRNPGDQQPIGGKSFDLAGLFGDRRATGPAAPQPRGVPVLYGGAGGKFSPEALRLGAYRTPAVAPPAPHGPAARP
jgi:pilus assembly protein CpaB